MANALIVNEIVILHTEYQLWNADLITFQLHTSNITSTSTY